MDTPSRIKHLEVGALSDAGEQRGQGIHLFIEWNIQENENIYVPREYGRVCSNIPCIYHSTMRIGMIYICSILRKVTKTRRKELHEDLLLSNEIY